MAFLSNYKNNNTAHRLFKKHMKVRKVRVKPNSISEDVSFGGKGAKLRKVNLSHTSGEDTASCYCKVTESILDPGGLAGLTLGIFNI